MTAVISEKRIADICELYLKGTSIVDIIEILRSTRLTIKRVLIANKIYDPDRDKRKLSDIWKYVKLDKKTNCLIWQLPVDTRGHGYLTYNGRRRQAHHLAYEHSTGKSIPLGKRLHHTCSNKNCVNPEHLYVGVKYINKPRDVFKHSIENPETGCWEWSLSRDVKFGYGQFTLYSNNRRAHRIAYEEHYMVKIPDGIMVCHTCDVPYCINPEHLFLGTHQDNMDDMMRKDRRNAAKGERLPQTVLTESQVLEIRSQFADSTNQLTYREVGESYGVTGGAVSDIVRRINWKHV